MRRDTNGEPSGVDLEQIDFDQNPDEILEGNLQIDDILEGLLWYPKFQIKLLKKRKRADKVNSMVIEKIKLEMKQSQIHLYREQAKREEEGFSID